MGRSINGIRFGRTQGTAGGRPLGALSGTEDRGDAPASSESSNPETVSLCQVIL